jgi:hypothetical protein
LVAIARVENAAKGKALRACAPMPNPLFPGGGMQMAQNANVLLKGSDADYKAVDSGISGGFNKKNRPQADAQDLLLCKFRR